eukprot:snap_masked-scaffold_92-processed-gene-0.13-mRNA-1 protein AED:0.65 eAED:0.65 QI:0/0/0/0.5/1/1/2/0/276
MTGEFNIYGRLKKLERTKVLLEWSEEINHACEKLMKEVKLAFSNTLGYYDQKLDLVLFVDASEFYWSYFICQTSDAIKLEFPMDANYDVVAMASEEDSLHEPQELILYLNPIKASTKSYSERLTHWSLIFQDICLEVHHIPGKQNVAADILSLWLNPEFDKVEADEVLVAVATVEHFNVQHLWEKVDELHAGLRNIDFTLKYGDAWPEMDESFCLSLQWKDIKFKKNSLRRYKNKLVVTKSLILPVIVHTHLRFNHGAADQEKNGFQLIMLCTLKK